MAITFLKYSLSKLRNKLGTALRKLGREDSVKSFAAHQKKEAAYASRNRGDQPVPLDRIIGSVGRYHDFDSKFQLKQHVPPERLQSIRKAMQSGKTLPP
ncbi:hypothetical protein ACFL9U_01110, partial [Thermodesulfobacteriota bacterium]